MTAQIQNDNITSSENQKVVDKKTTKKRNKNKKGEDQQQKYKPTPQSPFTTYNFSELKRIVKNSTPNQAISKIKATLAMKNKEIAYLKELIIEERSHNESIKEDLYFANHPEFDRYNHFY